MPDVRGRRILVTGSEGFIGRSLMHRLAALGHQPIGYDLVQGNDVLDVATLRAALRRVDAVVHLAGPSSAQMFVESPDASRHTTVEGIRNVLANFSGRVIFPSSSAAYGSSDLACSERAPLPQPGTLYASAKLTGEALCAEYNARGGDAKVARLFPCYGPGESGKGRYASALYQFARAAVSGREIVLFGNGRQKRDFLHVDDAVAALVGLLDTQSSEPIVNVGTGRATSFADVLGWLARHAGLTPKVVRQPAPDGYAKGCVADTTLAQRELGFRCAIPVEQGVQHLVHAIGAAQPQSTLAGDRVIG